MKSDWTDERVELARKMWADGSTASEIAAAIGGGISRNGVMGKVHRMGWTKRSKGLRQGYRYPPRTPGQPRGASRPQARHAARKGSPRVERQRLPSGALSPDLRPISKQDAEFDAAIPNEQRKTLVQLTDHTCRWPVGLPGTPEFFFCGAEPAGTLPYCPDHCRRAFDSSRLKNPPRQVNYEPRGIPK